jgi:cytochrome bd-type quinol oxidase subunit 2
MLFERSMALERVIALCCRRGAVQARIPANEQTKIWECKVEVQAQSKPKHAADLTDGTCHSPPACITVFLVFASSTSSTLIGRYTLATTARHCSTVITFHRLKLKSLVGTQSIFPSVMPPSSLTLTESAGDQTRRAVGPSCKGFVFKARESTQSNEPLRNY